MYLSPQTRQWKRDPQRFGLMLNIAREIGGQQAALEQGARWMLDNGAFSGKFTPDLWTQWLERLQPYRNTCIGVVVPDVVGDAAGTLARFGQYAPMARTYGYPVALATQDGMTPADVPWPEVDVLFVGGSTRHKLGKEAHDLIGEAKRRGLWVHVGRVNSAARIRLFPEADSYDGTTFARHPWQQYESIARAIDNRHGWPVQGRLV